MKPLNLYKIEPKSLPTIHIAARSSEQAAQMYVTWQAALGPPSASFSVEALPLNSLDPEQQRQVVSLLAASTEGIAFFQPGHGWRIDSGGWTSFAPGEEIC